MKTASAISTGLHVLVLAWATLSITGKTFEVTPAESLPVDLVSEKQFSELTKGVKDAPKPPEKPIEKPKPLVEKKAEEPPKPVEEIKPKVTEKKEVALNKEASAAPTPPPEPDPIADKLKKPDEKPQQAKAQPQPLPPRRPPVPKHKEPKFEPDKIAALLDKRDPARSAITGAEVNNAPTLGTASGAAARLSQSEIDALKARLYALWNPPYGARDAASVQITIRIRFKRDGTLADGPQVMTSGGGPVYNAMRDSAVRAVLVGQPYTMLRPEHYDSWNEIDFVFDSSQMYHDIPVR